MPPLGIETHSYDEGQSTVTTVIIWNNHEHPFGGHTYPGHAALSIRDRWDQDAFFMDYVSWWPNEGDDRRATPNQTFLHDLKEEGYAPDHVIHVTGLNETAMKAAWMQILNSVREYGFLRHNCSTIVARVLKAGSSAGGVLLRNNAIWTPLKVKRLALAMGGQKMSYGWLLFEMKKLGLITESEVEALGRLAKRDERHGRGSASQLAYFAQGQRIRPRDEITIKYGGIKIFGGGSARAGTTARTVTVSATDELQYGSRQAVSGDFEGDE